jgi:TrbM
MKKLIVATLLISLFAAPAHAKDPCSSVLCMAGLLQGTSVVDGCKGFVKDYFNIIKFNNHGGISLNKTFKARGSFLSKCGAAGIWPDMINSKYGRQMGF